VRHAANHAERRARVVLKTLCRNALTQLGRILGEEGRTAHGELVAARRGRNNRNFELLCRHGATSVMCAFPLRGPKGQKKRKKKKKKGIIDVLKVVQCRSGSSAYTPRSPRAEPCSRCNNSLTCANCRGPVNESLRQILDLSRRLGDIRRQRRRQIGYQ